MTAERLRVGKSGFEMRGGARRETHCKIERSAKAFGGVAGSGP